MQSDRCEMGSFCILAVMEHSGTFRNIPRASGSWIGFVLRIREIRCTTLHPVAWGCITLHRRRIVKEHLPLAAETRERTERRAPLLQRTRARLGVEARTTTPTPRQNRGKIPRIVVTPFARLERQTRTFAWCHARRER